MLFWVVSFGLIHPVDPGAFYHQRYVLPALLPIVAAVPVRPARSAPPPACGKG